MSDSKSRILFIDYLRAFAVLLVVLDHAAQGYTLNWKIWFLQDSTRDTLYDAFHLHNDSFYMSFLFFLAGLFTLSSLAHRGYWSFIKERFRRLGIPFLVFLPLVPPLLTYPKFYLENPEVNYWHYMTEYVFGIHYYDRTLFGHSFQVPGFGPELKSAGLWFLYWLMVLSLSAILINRLFPFVIRLFKSYAAWIVANPIPGFLSFWGLSFLIAGISEIFYGATYWYGFWGVFYVQGSRYLMYAFYFFVAVGFQQAGFVKDLDRVNKLSAHWIKLVLLMAVSGIAYILYAMEYWYDGAFSNEVLKFIYFGGQWKDAGPVILEHAPAFLIRSALHTFFCASQCLCYFVLFYKFLNKENPIWISLGACSYGIYLVHEPFTVWGHYYFMDSELPIFIKYVIVASVSVFVSWFIVQKILLKMPLVKRIL